MKSYSEWITDQEFQEMAAKTKQDYFPRWDSDGKWRFEIVADLDGLTGECAGEEKTIKVLARDAHEVPLRCWSKGLRPLLIHEICHAVAVSHHGQRWQNRMLKAAHDAESKYRDTSLAKEIREDVSVCREKSIPITSSWVYEEIKEVAIDVTRSSSSLGTALAKFDLAIDHVRRRCGMRKADFLKRFPRAGKVFEGQCRDTWHFMTTKKAVSAQIERFHSHGK